MRILMAPFKLAPVDLLYIYEDQNPDMQLCSYGLGTTFYIPDL